MSISNTNSTFSFDAWEKSALSELDTLQTLVSKALMKYQSNTDKTALGESANRYMGELRTAVTRILILTENEWEVSWLLICGFSIRGIAKYLNVSTKTVQVRASSAYMNLRVYDKCGLLKVAEKYNWVNFVPESFLALPALIRISLLN